MVKRMFENTGAMCLKDKKMCYPTEISSCVIALDILSRVSTIYS